MDWQKNNIKGYFLKSNFIANKAFALQNIQNHKIQILIWLYTKIASRVALANSGLAESGRTKWIVDHVFHVVLCTSVCNQRHGFYDAPH